MTSLATLQIINKKQNNLYNSNYMCKMYIYISHKMQNVYEMYRLYTLSSRKSKNNIKQSNIVKL